MVVIAGQVLWLATQLQTSRQKNYHILTVGQESEVLVLPPSTKQGTKKKGMVDVTAMRLDYLQQPTHVKRLFADLWKIHQEDHCKGSDETQRCQLCHYDVVVAQLVALGFIKSV
jgi:hypothetical protein